MEEAKERAKWYVMFTRTGAEERVVKFLNKKLDTSLHTTFVPVKTYPLIKKGKVIRVLRNCFPGYVFIRSTSTVEVFFETVVPLVAMMKEAYIFLCYGRNKYDIVMREHEQLYLERLLNKDFCMEESIGFIEGDRIRVTEGPMVGLESFIKRINKRKRTAVVEISIMGSVREITLMLDLIEKAD